MAQERQSLPFETSSFRRRYFKILGVLGLFAAGLPSVIWGMAVFARHTVGNERAAERGLVIPHMRFMEAAPQFKRPFNLALERHFSSTRSSFYSSPALSYLDKKGISTAKLVEQYENLWRLLEYLQLNRDFAFEERALRTFLTASSTEVIEALGDKGSMIVELEGPNGYKFLSEQGLAWYLQHYYLDPATDLTSAHQYGNARQLIYDALRRLQFRTIGLSRHLRIPEYDRTMLLAAIYSMPDALVGRDETLQLLLKAVRDDFPGDVQFEIESHPFAAELVPLQQHMLGIYDLRKHDYHAAIEKFDESSRTTPAGYLHELSTFMAVRARFWEIHDSLVKRKSTLSVADANKLAQMIVDLSQTVRAPNLRTNIREYVSLVKSDFTRQDGLFKKPAKEATRSPDKQPDPAIPPPVSPVVPAIRPLPREPNGSSR